MNEELKAQYKLDEESGYLFPWELWQWIQLEYAAQEGRVWWPCRWAPRWNPDCIYRRLPNADQIILEWQRAKYYEDSEWHPRPWELWQYKDDSGEWVTLGRAPGWYPRIHYRRRPDAPTREQWEAEQKRSIKNGSIIPQTEWNIIMSGWDLWRGKIHDGDQSSSPRDWFEGVVEYAAELGAQEQQDKCATCRHKYEPKQPTIHVSMQFPDGRTYEADLPEPMMEEPEIGEVYHIVFNDMAKFLFTWVDNEKEKRWLKQGMIHRTDADAEVWVDFFKQWRNDK